MKIRVAVFLFFGIISFAQKKEPLSDLNQTYGLELSKARQCSENLKFEDGIKVAKKVALVSYPDKDKTLTEEALKLISSSYVALAQIDSAQKYVSKAIYACKQNKSVKSLARCYLIQSQIYQYKADFTQQAAYGLKSIEIAKKIDDKELLEINYRNLAMLYLDHEDYQKALDFSKKSLEYATLLKDTKRISMANGAIGETYSMMYVDDKADYYFRKSYEASTKINYPMGTAWTLTNWANIKKGEEALKMREEAQKIWNAISADNIMSITNLGQIGLLYHEKAMAKNVSESQRKQFLDKAENYLFESIKKSKKSGNTTTYIESAEVLAEIYFAKKDFEKAYLLQNEYETLSDSLYSQENKNRIAALESKQKLMEKDQQIAIKQLTIKQNERQKWLLIASLVFLGIIGGLLYKQSRNRKKNNQLLQNLNTELDEANKTKTRFFSILNHDLRSPVSNLIDFLHLQKNSPDLLDDETRTRIEDATLNSAENLLYSMEEILQWSKSQMENFKPQPKKVAVSSLFEEVQNHFSSEENIRFAFENPESLQLHTDENYLKTIIRNLTGNAVKALRDIENPTITWRAWQKNKQTFLSITDNGKGATDAQFRALYDEKEVSGIKSGLGLHLIRDLAKAIDCEIFVDTKMKSVTTITLTLK
ncbi:ATP-binding protein [Flavobacterium sp.]